MTKQINYDQDYWNRFYAKQIGLSPSQFAALIATEFDGRCNILDVGCGNGRDADFFASLGHNVLGLDGSQIVVAANQLRINDTPHKNISYSTCRVGLDTLTDVTSSQVDGFFDDGDLVIYSRFFLHAIPPETEMKMIEELAEMANVKKVYFEYRCGDDEGEPKFFGEHYRRFVRPSQVSKAMQKIGSFSLGYEYIGRGVAKYRSEDAHVCRQFFER